MREAVTVGERIPERSTGGYCRNRGKVRLSDKKSVVEREWVRSGSFVDEWD